ncbi:MAG: hypothetical protein ACI8RD_012089, partial [Bacillariaceae sp.]
EYLCIDHTYVAYFDIAYVRMVAKSNRHTTENQKRSIFSFSHKN